MNLPKQLINIIGAVVVVAVVAAGIALVAFPLFLQAGATAAEAQTVAAGNAIYQSEVDALQEAEADIETIDANVAELRRQVPASNNLDEVFELVARAAAAAGVTVISVSTQDPTSYQVRTGVTEAGGGAPAALPGDSGTEADAGGGESAGDDTAGDGTAGDGTADDGSSDAGEQPEVVDGKAQIPLTIEVAAADSARVATFLDALQRGPRLVAVLHSAMAPAEAGLQLTVDALAYTLAEG